MHSHNQIYRLFTAVYVNIFELFWVNVSYYLCLTPSMVNQMLINCAWSNMESDLN